MPKNLFTCAVAAVRMVVVPTMVPLPIVAVGKALLDDTDCAWMYENRAKPVNKNEVAVFILMAYSARSNHFLGRASAKIADE